MVEEERILPSGFLIAAMLCWARGYAWLGGCFQGEYLTCWQRGTAAALAAAGHEEAAAGVLRCDCTGYISGPVFALCRTDDDLANPAGTVELIQAGGLTRTAFEKGLSATVQQGHEMGLLEFYGDLVPPAERMEGWSRKIARAAAEEYMEYIL